VYDAAGRPEWTKGPATPAGSAESQLVYTTDSLPGWAYADNPAGGGMIAALQIDYNARREAVRETDALGNAVATAFDLNGNPILRTDPGNLKTACVYDARNRLVEVRAARTAGADPGGADAGVIRTRFEYDANGNRTAVVDPRGNRYDFVVDAFGRRTAMLYPPVGGAARRVERWTYDGLGRPETWTDAAGQVAVFAYDALGRLDTETRYADAARTAVRARIARAYDASGRLASVDDGTIRVVYAYTGPGDGGQPVGLPKRVDWTVKGAAFKSVAYAYDARGRRTSMTEPEGAVVRYDYDAAGRILKIVRFAPGDEAGRRFIEHVYRKGGQVSASVLGNGATRAYTYDEAGRLRESLLTAASGRTLSDFDYYYDSRGNRTWTGFGHLGTSVTYGYDAFSRLVREECPGVGSAPPPYANRTTDLPGGNESAFSNEAAAAPVAEVYVPAWAADYAYDDAGNRTLKDDSRLGRSVCVYDAENRLVEEQVSPPGSTSADRFSYAYDGNGNLAERWRLTAGGARDASASWEKFGYDHANRLTAYVRFPNGTPEAPPDPEESATYLYAPTGERVLKTDLRRGRTTAFLYDGADVLADYDVPTSGVYDRSRSYVQGLGIDSKVAFVKAGAELSGVFFDTDALGSVHQVLSTPETPGADPEVLDFQLTTAWGEPVSIPKGVTRYGFTQRERDEESDLLYFRARHYSSRQGRFIQKDPVLENRPTEHYAYAGNNPVRYGDPTGETLVDWILTGRWNPSPEVREAAEKGLRDVNRASQLVAGAFIALTEVQGTLADTAIITTVTYYGGTLYAEDYPKYAVGEFYKGIAGKKARGEYGAWEQAKTTGMIFISANPITGPAVAGTTIGIGIYNDDFVQMGGGVAHFGLLVSGTPEVNRPVTLSEFSTLPKFGRWVTTPEISVTHQLRANLAANRAAINASKIDVHIAKDAQIRWGLNADNFIFGQLEPGQILVRAGGPGRWYTNLETLFNSGFNANNYASLTQIPGRNVPRILSLYRVTKRIPSPQGAIRANPDLGIGEGWQAFMQFPYTSTHIIKIGSVVIE
jgi:RHS repeat-associated protein